MSLGYKAALGAMWTITSSIGSRAVGLASTLVLTRFIEPSAFGAVSVASVILLTVNSVSTLGVGHYLVAFPKAGRDVAFHASVIYLSAAALAVACACALAAPLGAWFGEPGVTEYIPWFAAGIACQRIGGIPTRLLVRDMRFRVIGLSQVAGEFTYAASALLLAFNQFGAMSLVVAALGRDILVAAIVTFSVNFADWLTPVRLRLEEVKKLLRFGLPFGGSAVLDIGSRRWDNLMFAALFGTDAAGRYSLAYNLADVPAAQVGEHIGDVLLPSFSRMTDPEERKRGLVRAGGLLALLVFPLAVGLGAVAATLVETLFDAKWQGIAPLLMVLSVLSVVRPLGWLLSSYLLAGARTGQIFALQAIKALGIVGFIALLSPMGELAACAAVGLAFGAHALAAALLVRRADNISPTDLIGPMLRPLLACVPLAAAVWGVRYLVPSDLNALLRLGLEIGAGAAAYVATAFWVARNHASELIRLARGALSKRARKENA